MIKPIQELINFSIINIDKPSDWTSFDVVNYIRKALHLKKAGHFGTLDPMVTGVLPIGLEKTTKIQEFFMHKDKTYIGTMRLHKPVEKKELEEYMKAFIGKITQLPPQKSRVKRQERQREVFEFKILNIKNKGKDIEFIAKVEAGTYIRKLVHDLGLMMSGAHMTKLRRTQAGIFLEKDSITMDEFKQAMNDYRNGNEESLRKILIDSESVIKKIMPIIKIDKKYVEELKNGSPIFKHMIKIPKQDVFAIYCNKDLIEIAKKTSQFKNPEIIAKPEVVF